MNGDPGTVDVEHCYELIAKYEEYPLCILVGDIMPGIDKRKENWRGLYKVCQEMEREMEDPLPPRALSLKHI